MVFFLVGLSLSAYKMFWWSLLVPVPNLPIEDLLDDLTTNVSIQAKGVNI